MRYDAFISYRHAELDMEIAKKVHTGLETYKIPKSVQAKTGKKKMGRVFRDQEELPIGSDLDDNISTALQESEYLIVICSPRTPGSYWVCKEIESFIEMHDRNHILAVLIEGEPDESFPPQLLVDDQGNPVEPLAADVRGADKKERNNKFKTEILRLAAPIIGCTYDDLKQRHRERVIRRIVTIVSSAAAVIAIAGTAFGIYNANVADRMKQLADEKAALADEKTKLAEEISVQFRGKQENQSRFYAEESLTLLKNGNREDAILVAMEGLPIGEDDRPYVPEAEYALSRALYAYDAGDTLSYDRILHHDLNLKSMIRADDGDLIITVDSSNKVYVWDTTDWSLKIAIDPAFDEENRFLIVEGVDADQTGVYIITEKDDLRKYGYDGSLKYRVEFTEIVRSCEYCANKDKLIVGCQNSIYIIDPATGKKETVIENQTAHSFSASKYYPHVGRLIQTHYESEADNTYLTVVDVGNGEAMDLQTSEGYILASYITPNGNIAAVSCNDDLLSNGVNRTFLDLYDADGVKQWSTELNVHIKYMLFFNTNLKAHSFEEDGVTRNDIVVAIEAEAFTVDETTGKVRQTITLPGDANALYLMSSNSFGRVGYRQGGIDVVDFSEGRVFSEYKFETNDSVRDVTVIGTDLVYNSYTSPDLHVVAWHEAPDMEELDTIPASSYAFAEADDSSYFVMCESGESSRLFFYDSEGKHMYTFEESADFYPTGISFKHDAAYVSDGENIWCIDPLNKKASKIPVRDNGFNHYGYEARVSEDGSKCLLLYNYELAVMDLEKEEIIYTYNAETSMEKAKISADGSKIYVSPIGKNVYELNTADSSIREFTGDNLWEVAGASSDDFMVLSPDESKLAICCIDGYVRILDVASASVTAQYKELTQTMAFLSFTSDSKYLVIQGDDYKIRVIDTDDASLVTSVDGTASVDYIVCDGDSPLMAVCQGDGLFLFNTETFGCVGYSDSGLFYLENNDSIIICEDQTKLKRTRYKDYKTLMEEAKKQFPDASLADEKKVEYNIN